MPHIKQIGLEFLLSPDINVKTHMNDQARNLGHLCNRASFTDVTFHFRNGSTLSANKLVLANCSKLLSPIFNTSSDLFQPVTYDVFCLEFDPEAMRRVLQILHTGETQIHQQEIELYQEMNSILESLQINIALKGFGIWSEQIPTVNDSKFVVEAEKETSVTVPAVKANVYRCHICDKVFPFSIGLDKHMKKKHELATIREEIIPEPNEISKNNEEEFLLTSDDESLGEEETRNCEIGVKDQLDSDCESLENHVPLNDPSNSAQTLNRSSARKTKRRSEQGPKLESSPTLYRCNVCPRKMNSLNNINVHMAVLHYRNDFKEYYGEKEWTCAICQKEFDNERKLLSHLVVKHGKLNNVLKRKDKGKKKGKKANQRVDKYSCPTCTYSCPRYPDMILHVAATHHREEVLEIYGPNDQYCSICSKTFARGRGLIYHLITTHKDLQSFLPSRETLLYKRGARKNQPISETPKSKTKTLDKPATCSKCKKTCADLKTLRRHWALIHFRQDLCDRYLRQNPTKCHFCSKTIEGEPWMLSHLVNVHRVLNPFLPTTDDIVYY